MPWLADMEQEMLENTEPYTNPDGLAADFENPRELILAVIDSGHGSEGGRRTQVYVNEFNGKEFIVPANCVIRRIDFMGDPVLVRRRNQTFF